MSRVKIYTILDCPYCESVKQFLKKYEVEFKNSDISNSSKEAEEMVRKSGQLSPPVVVIRKNGKDEVVVGFDEKKLAEILDIIE
ncbi:MAG: glutaredoxin domain-containing protein [bacterium]